MNESATNLRQSDDAMTAEKTTSPSSHQTLRVFLSHSSRDEALAAALVELFKSAVGLRASQIRCSTVNGYRLPAGVNVETQLRQEVKSTEVVVGLVTPSSLASHYVMFELGARWGAERFFAPVLAGLGTLQLEPPLSLFNALSAHSESHLHQLVADVARILGLELQSVASYLKDVQATITLANSTPKLDQEVGYPATALPSETVHTVSFDYIPASPLDNGWTQIYDADGRAEFGRDLDIPGSLRIKVLKSEVAIRHHLPPQAILADHLEFTARYTNTSHPTMIFTRLTVGSKDDSVRKQVDIKYYYGDLLSLPTAPNPQPRHDPNKWLPEQTLFWPANVLSGGRLAFNIDLRKIVDLSLGSQGWVFKSINGVTLRGDLSISPMVLGKSKSATN